MTCFRDHVHRCQGKIDEMMNAAFAAHTPQENTDAPLEFWEGIRLYVENRVEYDWPHNEARDAAIEEASENFKTLLGEVITEVSREANFDAPDV